MAEQFLHTEKVVGSDPTFTTKLWVLSKMNITFRYERKSGSLILSGPSIYTPIAQWQSPRLIIV